jgi:hypothetical protein
VQRALVPGSATALSHPPQICLREDLVTPAVNRWIGQLFDPLHRETTITTLLASDDSADRRQGRVRELQDRIQAAEAAMERLRRALDAGWIRPSCASVQPGSRREARSRGIAGRGPHEEGVSRQELEAMIDGLGASRSQG